MPFDGLYHVGIQPLDVARGAKGAVFFIPPRAARDLRQFRAAERTHRFPVELARGGQRDMMNVHIQTHANRIGRHHKIHFTRLIHFHLRVAGARG